MIRDTHIRDDVQREIFYTCGFNPASVGVAVEEGIVTLTGTLNSYEQKLAALRAAARVPHVRAIACELEVPLPGPRTAGDSGLARGAANLFACNAPQFKDRVRIVAENGWITLQGTVESNEQKDTAADVLKELAGLKGVDNLITVGPAIDAEAIKDRIEADLAINRSIDDRNILVEVNHDRVVLHGEVRSATEREEAERIAWSSAGVSDVANHILVSEAVASDG
jgi:osmotically-inducible protein OsmY